MKRQGFCMGGIWKHWQFCLDHTADGKANPGLMAGRRHISEAWEVICKAACCLARWLCAAKGWISVRFWSRAQPRDEDRPSVYGQRLECNFLEQVRRELTRRDGGNLGYVDIYRVELSKAFSRIRRTRGILGVGTGMHRVMPIKGMPSSKAAVERSHTCGPTALGG